MTIEEKFHKLLPELNKSEALKPLLYADIKKGMKVVDGDGDIGIITECEDAHNVIVQYENGGKGIHCLVEGCELFGSLLYVCR